MAKGKNSLSRGLDSITWLISLLKKGPKAKTFLILMLTTFLIVVCASGAFAFQGSVSGLFTNPQPNPDYNPSAMRVWEQGANSIVYGGSSPLADNNHIIFTGAENFDTTVNQPFTLGEIEFHNATTSTGASPVAVDLVIELTFTDPAGIDQEFTHTLTLLQTANTSSIPEENADTIIFPFDTVSSETVVLDGLAYTLRLTALEVISGDGFIDPDNPNYLSAY